MKNSRVFSLLTGGILACFALHANSDGSLAKRTGAPGDDGTCGSCHAGSLNPSIGRVSITFPGGTSYEPGRTVRMRVTVEDPNATRWGFSLTAKREGSSTFAGSLAVPATPATAVVRVVASGADRYINQSASGTFRQQITQAAWDFDWTAPAAGTGNIRFYAAAVAANNDLSQDGDRVYTSTLAITEGSSGPPPVIPVGNTVLPQFAFGGGWTSSLYFANNSDVQVSFPVNFYNDFGVALSFGGVSTRQVILPGRSTSLILAPNTGSLQQGWATFDLPAGVTGYGVFRQTGNPDQEAVVPFASSSATRSSMIYDDSNLVTAVAIWYNGAATTDVTITVRDEGGSVVGTANVPVSPGTKAAFALSERIPAITGKRGIVEFTAPSGNLAVTGLRFATSAFTSIPAAP